MSDEKKVSNPQVPEDGLFYEDIAVGDVFATPSHVVTREDIALFCKVTLDDHPLHTDDDYARRAGFPGIIAHGLYGLSLMEGLKTRLHLYDHSSIASLGWDKIKFRSPILPGDKLHVTMQFLAKRPSRSRPAGIVTEEVLLLRDDGTCMISGEHLSFLRSRADNGPEKAA